MTCRFDAPKAAIQITRACCSTGTVKVRRCGGGLGASVTTATHNSRSSSATAPGKSDATCPSSPTPSTTRSMAGGVPNVRRNRSAYAVAAATRSASPPSMGCARASRRADVPSQPARVAPKFDCGSSGGTARSSHQNMSVLDQSIGAPTSDGRRAVASDPPGTAIEKRPRAAIAWCAKCAVRTAKSDCRTSRDATTTSRRKDGILLVRLITGCRILKRWKDTIDVPWLIRRGRYFVAGAISWRAKSRWRMGWSLE